MRRLLFISHPNVVVNREIPVPQWHLSAVGQQRMRAALAQPWIPEISAVYCTGLWQQFSVWHSAGIGRDV